MKRLIYSVLAAVSAILFVSEASAQVVAFNVNPDPVAAGLAGNGTALYATSFAIYNNTASTLFEDTKMDVGVSYGLWQPGFSSNNVVSAAGYGRVTKFMTVAAGVKYLTHQSFDKVDEIGMTVGTVNPNEVIAGIGLGFKILPIMSLSVNANYVHSNIGAPKNAGAFAADFGLMLDLKFMRIGLTANNIGTGLNYGGPNSYPLPSNIKLGLGTIQSLGAEKTSSISAFLDAGYVLDRPAEKNVIAGVGVEYAWKRFFRVSAGYHYGNDQLYVPGQYVSVGLGTSFFGVSLNASYMYGLDKESTLSNTFSIGIGYSF